MNTKKILVLGYIPKAKGGKQKTGLATGIFDLHNAINNQKSEYEVTIAATDINDKKIKIDNTTVIGWSIKILMSHLLKRFYRVPFFAVNALILIKYYPISKFSKTFVKLLFLDYAIDLVKPNTIHLHGCYYALFRKSIWKNIPTCLRIHGINGDDKSIKNHRVYQKIEQDISKLNFTFVTFVTTAIRDSWQIMYGKFNCKMIPLINGFNPTIFSPPKAEVKKKYDLITFSGIQERKGQLQVVMALNELKNSGINLSYLIIGAGHKDYTDQIKKYVNLHSLNVTFIDYCDQKEIVKYLWQSKFFILPSTSEGFGKVYIESIASGVPVIIPKNLPIVLEDNLISPINSILLEDCYSENIYKTLKYIDFKAIFDQNIVATSITHLSWEKIAQRYLNLFNSAEK